tara:strand:+ start:835 stop:1086 length:252 start_codon:yes stop_codon:yes gene_type:complete
MDYTALMGLPSGQNHLRESFGLDKGPTSESAKDANFLLNTYGQIAVGIAAGSIGGYTGAVVGGAASLVSKIIDKATENNENDK